MGPSNASFTLAVWNVLQGLDRRSKRSNRYNNDAIDHHIANLDADVLVLPEMWRFRQPAARWAEDLAASLGYELHQWISDSPSRPTEIVNWRMVIMTRIPATRLDDHLLPKPGGLGRRAFVRIQLPSGISIAGTHLYGIHALKRGVKLWRTESAELGAVADSHDIVAGDMNMWGPVVRRDAGDLRLAVKGRTYPSHRPHSQIDHVLVNERIEVLDAQVLDDMGSDHRAVRVTLKLK